MRCTKSQVIDNWSILDTDWKTDANRRVILNDRARSEVDSSTSGSSKFTFCKWSVTIETGVDGNSKSEENSIAGRHTTQSASMVLSVWQFKKVLYYQAKTWVKLFKIETAVMSCASPEKHVKLEHEISSEFDDFISRAEPIFVTKTSQVWESYFIKTCAILVFLEDCKDGRRHLFGRPPLAKGTLQRSVYLTTDTKRVGS